MIEFAMMTSDMPLLLCIDDETVGLKIRKAVLERAGYQVLTAENGFQGLEMFASQPVQLVVLDYAMPGMHGGEVAARMRNTKPNVPILLLSAYVDLAPEVTSLVDLYLTKGSGAPALIHSVGTLLASQFLPLSDVQSGGARPL